MDVTGVIVEFQDHTDDPCNVGVTSPTTSPLFSCLKSLSFSNINSPTIVDTTCSENVDTDNGYETFDVGKIVTAGNIQVGVRFHPHNHLVKFKPFKAALQIVFPDSLGTYEFEAVISMTSANTPIGKSATTDPVTMFDLKVSGEITKAA